MLIMPNIIKIYYDPVCKTRLTYFNRFLNAFFNNHEIKLTILNTFLVQVYRVDVENNT